MHVRDTPVAPFFKKAIWVNLQANKYFAGTRLGHFAFNHLGRHSPGFIVDDGFLHGRDGHREAGWRLLDGEMPDDGVAGLVSTRCTCL